MLVSDKEPFKQPFLSQKVMSPTTDTFCFFQDLKKTYHLIRFWALTLIHETNTLTWLILKSWVLFVHFYLFFTFQHILLSCQMLRRHFALFLNTAPWQIVTMSLIFIQTLRVQLKHPVFLMSNSHFEKFFDFPFSSLVFSKLSTNKLVEYV